MKYSSIPLAQVICTECKNFDIEHVVISPGSRNAPLTLSFTADSFFKCYSIVDERSAAFFALGIAQQLKKPVALVCTSGSALLNYYPAIVEAYYAQVPLVVISADRPPYLIDKGDGQTIRQDGVFFNHIGDQVNLIQDASHAYLKRQSGLGIFFQSKQELQQEQEAIKASNTKLVRQALTSAYAANWPVHLNAPFEEPLYQLEEISIAENPMKINAKSHFEYDWELLLEHWNKAKKKLLIIGQCSYEQLSKEVINLLGATDDFLVMTETTSNAHHQNFIERIDSLLIPLENKNNDQLWLDLQPDLVITIGGAIVSKKIKQFLRTYAPKQHWHWGLTTANDTFFKLNQHLELGVTTILSKLQSSSNENDSSYKSRWISTYQQIIADTNTYLEGIEFSDLWVHAQLSKLNLGHVLVHYANSASIRYAQLIPNLSTKRLYCNRGASGIDGSTSTAVGASMTYPGISLMISGDLSFLYDSNALWNAYLHKNFRIIVINNSGGGIFRILPTAIEDKNFETYFETPHQVNIEALCKAYGLSYSRATDKNTLLEALTTFLSASKQPKLLEVQTPKELNDVVLTSYFEFLTNQIN